MNRSQLYYTSQYIYEYIRTSFRENTLETNESSVMQTKCEKINNRMSVITEKYLRTITVKTFKQSENNLISNKSSMN